jgi:hypothetical protein
LVQSQRFGLRYRIDEGEIHSNGNNFYRGF